MPYKKKKNAKNSKVAAVPTEKIDEEKEVSCDSDDDDLETVASAPSECAEEEDPEADLQQYETAITTGLELAQEKNKKPRLEGLNMLVTTLQIKSPLLADIVVKHIETLCDLVERSLKRGGGEAERGLCAVLGEVLVVVALQLGEEVAEEVYRLLLPCLLRLPLDSTLAAPQRSAACRTLAVLAYFAAPDTSQLCATVNTLYSAFESALPKGDGSLPALSPGHASLHSAALQGFLLLLPLMGQAEVAGRRAGLLRDLTALLPSPHLLLRCQCGTGIALVFSLLCEGDAAPLRPKEQRALLVTLADLVTDSVKHRSKKELKSQRGVFRAVVSTVESYGEYHDYQTLNFRHKGANTDLTVDSWEEKIKYDVVAGVLGEGVHPHMVCNDGLRQFFAVNAVYVRGKNSRDARALNGRQEKARHLDRRRGRARRSNAIHIMDEEL